jgi:hypothetical protein
MPARPRDERGWWVERMERNPLYHRMTGRRAFFSRGHCPHADEMDNTWMVEALWRLARLRKREVERLRGYIRECKPCYSCPRRDDPRCRALLYGKCRDLEPWKEATR